MNVSLSKALRFAGVSSFALLAANCASDTRSGGRQLSAQNQREIGAFADKRKYGTASPRVVEYGQEVPKGGGRDHLGRPYRVAGRWYTPRENPGYSAVGAASWYGDAFHGRKTANGEVYDKYSYTAAHPTMPLPSYARVTNLSNNRSIIVRVNDRGPFHGGRIIDLSERVAHALDFKHIGTARVKVDYVQRASVAGSDDRLLVATLRTDGAPAQMPGSYSPVRGLQPVMVASSSPTQAAPIPGLQPRPTTAPILPPAPATIAYQQQQQAAPPEPQRAESEEREAAPVLVAENRPVRRQMPLPQDRPFDLGTIPGAGTPIDRVNNGEMPVGQQPPAQRVAAVYFAPVEGFQAQFGRYDPMRKLAPGSFDPRPLQPVAARGTAARTVR
jgi:rare lipoprotein A